MRITLAAMAFAAAALGAAPAFAQLSEGGGPVSYSADNLEYFDADRRLVLVGDVDIVQNDARLRADRITLTFSRSTSAANGGGGGGLGSGDIESMVAEGEVYYVRPAQSARGNRAVYNTAADNVQWHEKYSALKDEVEKTYGEESTAKCNVCHIPDKGKKRRTPTGSRWASSSRRPTSPRSRKTPEMTPTLPRKRPKSTSWKGWPRPKPKRRPTA
jgi:lipopolysaccharide export system protein LptA